jgi:hypothetical protein
MHVLPLTVEELFFSKKRGGKMMWGVAKLAKEEFASE